MKNHIYTFVITCIAWAALLFLLLTTGCATAPRIVAPPPVVVTRPVVTGEIVSYSTIERELTPLMAKEYDPKLILMDAVYGAIPEEAARRIINEALAAFDTRWIEETRDCDDLSLDAIVLMRHLYRRDTGNVPLAPPIGLVGGALVGNIPEFKFVSPGFPLYHAMVALRCQGGKWLLVEVESKQIMELTGPIYEGSFELFLGVF